MSMPAGGEPEQPDGPYRGLAPFGDDELDSLLFFGREREREVIAANLMASPLTILYGPSTTSDRPPAVVRTAVSPILRSRSSTPGATTRWRPFSTVFAESSQLPPAKTSQMPPAVRAR